MALGFQSTLSSLQRALNDFGQFWREDSDLPALRPDLPPKDAERLRQLMAECLAAPHGEVAARQQAALLGELYLTLEETGRRRFLETLVRSFTLDRSKIKQEARNLLEAVDEQAFMNAATHLHAALESPQQRLLQLFNAVPHGVKFLIDLRADLLQFRREDPSLKPLDRELRQLLATWFDVGFLEVERITWQSPAALLEKLITYEAVHTIHSWQDLHNRLESDRHCYAFFHPVLPDEPLIFIEVALVEGLAASIQGLLDPAAPDIDPTDADTAIFYSISNTQAGLQGISFGPFLIKQVVTTLRQELPNLKTFSTLSPIPGFRPWLEREFAAQAELPEAADLQAVLSQAARELGTDAELGAVVDHPNWPQSEAAASMKEPLLRLAARYLHDRRERDGAPCDPVARFHLGNGARIEQINWLGDISGKGRREACGLMVNYLYRLKDIERNIAAYAADKEIAASSRVRNLLRPTEDDEGRLARLSRMFPSRRGEENTSETSS